MGSDRSPRPGREGTFTVCEVWDVRDGKIAGIRNLGDGRPAQVAGEPLELGPVARRDGDVGVDVDAEGLGAALGLARARRVDDAEKGLIRTVAAEGGPTRRGRAQRGQGELLAGWRRHVALAGAIDRPAMPSEDLLDPVRAGSPFKGAEDAAVTVVE